MRSALWRSHYKAERALDCRDTVAFRQRWPSLVACLLSSGEPSSLYGNENSNSGCGSLAMFAAIRRASSRA